MRSYQTIRVESTDWPQLTRVIRGALKATIDAHGPVTKQFLDSASKRVLSALTGHDRQRNKYERRRQLKHRAMMMFE